MVRTSPEALDLKRALAFALLASQPAQALGLLHQARPGADAEPHTRAFLLLLESLASHLAGDPVQARRSALAAAAELDKLRGPLAALNPQWFTLEMGFRR